MHSHSGQVRARKFFQILSHCQHSGVSMRDTPNGALSTKNALIAKNVTGSENKQAKGLTSKSFASARSGAKLDDRRALANVMKQAPAKLLHRGTTQGANHKADFFGTLGEVQKRRAKQVMNTLTMSKQLFDSERQGRGGARPEDVIIPRRGSRGKCKQSQGSEEGDGCDHMSLRAPEAVEARGTEPSDTNELRYALTEAHVGGTSLN